MPNVPGYATLQVPVCPTLNHASERRLVVLDRDLARSIIQVGIGLDEDLTGLLVGKDNVADLGAPEVSVNSSHVNVEVRAGLNISGGLVDVQLLQVLGNSYTICKNETLGSWDLGNVPARPAVRILERSNLIVRSDRSLSL